jgi:hypothetical protein
MAPEPFVGAEVVAEFLSITRRQALEMARKGELPAHPLRCGRRRTWRFRLSEVSDDIVSGVRKAVWVSLPKNAQGHNSSHATTITAGSPWSQKEKSNG